jgi:hypothetical protein
MHCLDIAIGQDDDRIAVRLLKSTLASSSAGNLATYLMKTEPTCALLVTTCCLCLQCRSSSSDALPHLQPLLYSNHLHSLLSCHYCTCLHLCTRSQEQATARWPPSG